jgi:hypothetical protein
MRDNEAIRWAVQWQVEKRRSDDPSETPFEVIEGEGNLLVDGGAQRLLDLLIGAGGNPFSSANARLGVGDSAQAASATQTDLQGASKTRKAMEAGYPIRSGQSVTFRSVFTSAEANYAWHEWGIFDAAAAGTMLNRKATELGTKVGGSWSLQVTISVS